MKHLYRLLYPPAWSIAAKISLALLSAVLIPMSFNAYYNLQHSLDNAEQNEYRKLELLATSTASRLDQLIIDSQKIAIQVSTEPKVVGFVSADTAKERQELQPAVQSTLKNIFRSDVNYDSIFLLDPQGNCLAATDSNFMDRNFSSQEYFSPAIQGHQYASNILVDNITKRSGVYLSQPIWSSQAKVIGVAVLKIKEENLNQIINRLKLESNTYPFLIDSLGVIINHPQKDYIYHSLTALSPKVQTMIAQDNRYSMSNVESLNLSQLAKAMIGAREPGHANYFSPLENKRQIVGFAPLEVQPWVLGISEPENTFAEPLNRLVWENILNLLIVGAIAAIVALLLANSIARPIKKLTKVARSLEQGNFEQNNLLALSHSQDDIGQLVRVFMNMAQEVESREQKLKQKVNKLNIEVDRAKKSRQVEEVTGTRYFQELQQRAKKLRKRNTPNKQDWQEHFQQLRQKAKKIKNQWPATDS
jgi:C4-dicarboxylate-specific signal transduction histidine kinase